MTNVYLVRHSKTKWNIEHRMQGRKDSSLTDSGKDEATKTAKKLSKLQFDVVYSSPSERALEITKLINNPNTFTNNLLYEMDFGAWEGKLFTEIANSQDIGEFITFHGKPESFRSKNNQGETYFQVLNRILIFFGNYIFNNSFENILVVSHGIVIDLFLNYSLGNGLSKFRSYYQVDNASISKLFIQNNNISIDYANDISHL